MDFRGHYVLDFWGQGLLGFKPLTETRRQAAVPCMAGDFNPCPVALAN